MDSTICSPLVENEPIQIDQKIDSPDDSVATIPEVDNLPKPPISILSNDILALIFKMIPIAQWPSLKAVSRQFRGAIRKAWTNLDTISLNDFVFNENMIEQSRSVFLTKLLENLRGKSPNITSISDFSAIVPMMEYSHGQENMHISSQAARRLAYFKNLESIDFAGSHILSRILATFLKSSASRGTLKYLNISDSHIHSFQDISKALKADGDLPEVKLETLVIETAENKYRNGHVIITLSLSLPWLTTLRATGTHIEMRSIRDFLKISTQLKRLEFNLYDWHTEALIIGQQAIFDAIADLEDLSILKISVFDRHVHCQELHSALINLIISIGRRGKLTSFGLANWKYLSEEVAIAIADHLIDLTSLELSICQWELISIDLAKLTRLESLCLGYQFSTELINETISAIASNFINLKCLHLVDFPESSRLESEMIKFQDLNSLLNLKELHIQDSRISDKALVSWADSIAPNLEILELMGCKNLTSIGFIPLIKHMLQIRRLIITDTIIDDCILPAIAFSCPNLENLVLSILKEPRSASIQSIIDQCPYLKEIRIKSDTWIYPNQLKFPKYKKILTEWKRET